MSFWSLALFWFVLVLALWRAARSAKRSLEARLTRGRAVLSSALTGLYITYTFAPAAISAGFAAVPVPASFALALEVLGLHPRWADMRPSILSLAVCFVVVTVVHYPFACAARRARERDRLFDAAQRLKA
jgi:hypothetical protein